MEDISIAILGLSSKSNVVKPIDLGHKKIAGHGVDGYLFKSCICLPHYQGIEEKFSPIDEQVVEEQEICRSKG